MVVEQTVGRAEHSFAVVLRIPRHAHARLDIVLVGLNSLLQPQKVITGLSKCSRWFELGGNLDVVTNAVVQRHIWPKTPGILPEESQRFIRERVFRTTEPLDEISRKPRAISLHGREAGERNRKAKRRQTDAAEIVHAPIVNCERGADGQVVKVCAEFGVAATEAPREVVSELVSIFGALDIRVRLASKICEARN